MDPDLYNAAICGSSDLSERVTEFGSNIYLGQVTSQNNTILHVAAKSGQTKLAEDVLCSNANASLLHETNTKGNTALHIAARLGHLEMIRVLANKAKEQELEADISLLRMANSKGDTALHEAVRNGHFQPAILLIDEDRDLTCFVNAAVIRAHKCNQFKSSTEKQTLTLWNKLSYINQFLCPNFPLTKYELSITRADFVGKILKKCPSSMVEADDSGWVPLHYAAHLGSIEAVELFLEINHSSVVYIKDKQGMSALHIAAKEGRVEVMESIIAKCPDTCELLDDRDRTALHSAVESGKKKAVKFLLGTMAFQDLINEPDQENNTPLHLAALHGHSKNLEIFFTMWGERGKE